MFKKIKFWTREIYQTVAGYDPTSWISHWLLTIVSTVAVASLLDAQFARLWAEILFGFFAFREGHNWATHQLLDDKPGFKRDGVLDMLGPTLNLLIWALL